MASGGNMRVVCLCVLVVLSALFVSAEAVTSLRRVRHQLRTRGTVGVGSLHVSIEDENNHVVPRLMTVYKMDGNKVSVDFRRTSSVRGHAKKTDTVTFDAPEEVVDIVSCATWQQRSIRVDYLQTQHDGPVIRFHSLISCELFNKLLELAAEDTALPIARSLDLLARDIVSKEDCAVCEKVNTFYSHSGHDDAKIVNPEEEEKLCAEQKTRSEQNGGQGAVAEKGKKDLKACLWFVAAHKGALAGKVINRDQCKNKVNNLLDADERSQFFDSFCYQELQVCSSPMPTIRANRGFELFDLDLLYQLRGRSEQNMKMTVLNVQYANEIGSGSGLTYDFLQSATKMFLDMLKSQDAINIFLNDATGRDLMTIPSLETMFVFSSDREADKKQEVAGWIEERADLFRMFGRTLAFVLNLQYDMEGVKGNIIIPLNLPAMLLQKLLTPNIKATYDWQNCPLDDLLCNRIDQICGKTAFADCYRESIKGFVMPDGQLPCFGQAANVPEKKKKVQGELHLFIPADAEPATYAEYAGMWADHLYSLKNPAFKAIFEGFWEVFAEKKRDIKAAFKTGREGMGSTYINDDGVVDPEKLDAFALVNENVEEEEDAEDAAKPDLRAILKKLFGVPISTDTVLRRVRFTSSVPPAWEEAITKSLEQFDRYQLEKFVYACTGRMTLKEEGTISIGYSAKKDVPPSDLPEWPKASTCASSLTFFGPVKDGVDLQRTLKTTIEQYIDAAAGGFNEV